MHTCPKCLNLVPHAAWPTSPDPTTKTEDDETLAKAIEDTAGPVTAALERLENKLPGSAKGLIIRGIKARGKE